jgi:hypothetical protein
LADDFASQIRAFRDKALANANFVVQEATAGIATALVARTPIDETTLRANWQFAAGEPPLEDHPEAIDESSGGADTAAVLTAEIREVPAGGITYLRNNRPYMGLIEYGQYTNIHGNKRNSQKTINGFSTQAPAGVIGVTAVEWEEGFVKPAIAKLNV